MAMNDARHKELGLGVLKEVDGRVEGVGLAFGLGELRRRQLVLRRGFEAGIGIWSRE